MFLSNLNCTFEFFWWKMYCRGGSRLNRLELPLQTGIIGAAGTIAAPTNRFCRGV